MPEDLIRGLEARFPTSGRFRASVRELLRAHTLPLSPSTCQALIDAYRRAAETRSHLHDSRRRLAEIRQDLDRLDRAHRRYRRALAALDEGLRHLGTQMERLARRRALGPSVSSARGASSGTVSGSG